MSATYKLSNDVTLGRKVYDCIITVGASGAVDAASPLGEGILSVTKEATAGQYTIELSDLDGQFDLQSVLGFKAGVSGASLDDVTAQVISDTVASDGKLVLQMLTAGVAADVTAANNIHLEVSVKVALV